MTDTIYRNPLWTAGPDILTASDLEDRLDWGQVALGIKEIWAKSSGKGILVGVCDTGRPVHPDLQGKVRFSKNFSSSDSDIDRQGHSLHVCGTIAAKADGKGVVGVAPDAELCIAKVLGDDGSGSNRGVSAGIRYCLENNCDIISMSLGGGYDAEIEAAVKEAVNAGVFVICAAGNSGEVPGQNTVNFPAKLDQTVAVGAYNKRGEIAKFSSRGKEVDIAFPGEEIVSTWLNGGYRALSGTSMATPYCSGVVALYLELQRTAERENKPVDNPVRNNADLLQLLKAAAVDKGPSGHDASWGWGIVDVAKFTTLKSAQGPVTPPAGDELDLGLFKARVLEVSGGWAGDKPRAGLFLYI